RGIVQVRITGLNQDDVPLISFERRALIPEGKLEGRAHPDAGDRMAPAAAPRSAPAARSLPPELASRSDIPAWPGRPRGLFEDFETGDTIFHDAGHTVGESEHMQLTLLSRNSHPLHVDEVYSRDYSFAGTRVVCGGLVFAWAAALASRDTSANALWEIGYDNGRHCAPVLAGDTLYAASRVSGKRDHDERAGIVEFHLVCVKNERPDLLRRAGVDLFEGKFEQKAFEIEREILLPKKR
ncbi:MAG TPA: MaoC/PaaZ C-terminal domain-containing protein, partial [Blastocatellia bacterium]|nr:MaoC/PaaZ C-terminal domain-containing protein [Blastocatellia bacterium]